MMDAQALKPDKLFRQGTGEAVTDHVRSKARMTLPRILQLFVVIVSVPLGISGGCACFGSDVAGFGECSQFGSSITQVQFEQCSNPQLIGKSTSSVIIAIPTLRPRPEPDLFDFIMRIESVGLDGAHVRVHELNYYPSTMASNGDYVAWGDLYGHVVFTYQTGAEGNTEAALLGTGEYINRLKIAGRRLAIETMLDGYLVLRLIDLPTQKEVLRMGRPVEAIQYQGQLYGEPESLGGWDLSSEWLVVTIIDESELSERPKYLTRLYSLTDGLVQTIQKTARGPYGLVIDPVAQTVSWMESALTASYYGYPSVSLMRWDLSTGQPIQIDPLFLPAQEGAGSNGPDQVELQDANAGNLLVRRYSQGYISYTVRKEDTPEVEATKYEFLGSNYSYPVCVQRHAVWLDNARRKIKMFDSDAQTMQELDLPAD